MANTRPSLFSHRASLTEGGEFPPQGCDLRGEPGGLGGAEDPAGQEEGGGDRGTSGNYPLPQQGRCPGRQGAAAAEHATPPASANGLVTRLCFL